VTSLDRSTGFLRSCGMYHGDVDVLACTRRFLEDMDAGLQGRPSSLRMIPTFIEVDAAIPPDRPVLAVDAGGTNLRVALVDFDAAGAPRYTGFERHRMPGLDGEIGVEAFFEALAARVRPVVGGAGRMGLSFSYPAEILPSRDGRILGLSKELRVAGIAGELVGERLCRALRAGGAAGELHFVVLNDTVGALLAGRAARAGHPEARQVGYVLGTGLNCAYVEDDHHITKVPGLPPGRQVVNVEAGNWDGAPRGAVDRALDAASAEPGTYLLEKAVSGAYLGALCLRTLQAAAEDGLFTQGGAACLRGWPRLDTPELDPLLSPRPAAEGLAAALARGGSGDDLVLARALASAVVERAAQLAAVVMGAAALRSQGPAGPAVRVTADGSTFYKLPTFQGRITGWVERIVAGKCAVEVGSVEHAALLGAAVGGATN
jgi:hexokinase